MGDTTNAHVKLIGKRFGKLVVTSFAHQDKYRHIFWRCTCDCGGVRTTCSRQLIGGRTKSCGCLPRPRGKANKQWKGVGELGLVYFHAVKNGAIRRGLEFDLTIEQCWKLFVAQRRKCKLSGLPLVFRSCQRQHDGTASLDRIDSAKGYTLDNVQWIHKDINQMKMEFSEDYFLTLVHAIAKHTS